MSKKFSECLNRIAVLTALITLPCLLLLALAYFAKTAYSTVALVVADLLREILTLMVFANFG
jgi:hypothetical protein